MSNKMIFLGFILISVAIVGGLMLAPGQVEPEDFYADATSHLDNMDNISVDYYKGWMDALQYYEQFNENNTESK